VGCTDRTTAVEYLTEAECWRLLACHAVGRLGVTARAGPEIYPVNYVVEGGAVLFRTDPGGKLASLTEAPGVCLEIDDVDADARTGWSVLVKGRAHQLDPDEHDQVAGPPLDYWIGGPKAHWVRIDATEVTGRRIWQPTPSSGPPRRRRLSPVVSLATAGSDTPMPGKCRLGGG